jgi:hypothetical protein
MVSVGAHIALFGLLLQGGSGDAPTPYHAPIIQAELVQLAARSAPPAAAPSEETADEVADAAPPAGEPVAAAPAEPQPQPLPADPVGEPDEAIASDNPPATEPPAPVPPIERVATVDVPASDEPATVASGAEVPATAPAPTPNAAPSVSPPARGSPMPERQQQMLGKRLASWTGRFTPGEPDPTLAWREDGQKYTAVLKRLPAADDMGMEHLVVEVSTEQDGNRMLTDLRLTRVAFSNFAQFVDRWDSDVQIHDDEINGRFHSNTEINVDSSAGVQPIFRGRVTLAARDIGTNGRSHVSRRKMFPAGLETGVRKIVLPAQIPPLADGDVTAEQVQRFDRDAHITFHADGTYAWRYVEAAESDGEYRRTVTDLPHYLLGAADTVLHVRGTVNGKILVYTPERIVITDDLRYAQDPRSADADDYLGLVAEKTVEIAEPDITGPGDLEVHASIYARRQFAVRNYRSRASGTLIIYGSLASGSITATEPRFATKIEFDERLATARAPSFPLSDRYELESWSGEWRAEPLPP